MSKTSERLLSAKESLRNEAMFRTLANTTNAAVFIYQGAENKYVNPAAVSLTGYSEEELLSLKFWELLHPDYREKVRQRGRERLGGTAVPSRYEVKIVTKQGEERWLDFTGQRFTYNGRPAVLGTAIDITHYKVAEEALRESEARYRLLADNSTDMISKHSPEGIYQYVSPAVRALLGYDPEDLLEKDPYHFIHPEDTDIVKRFHQSILSSRETFTVTYRIRRQDGNYIWFESTCKGISTPGTASVVGIEVISRDITARIRADQELQKHRRELEKTVRARTAELTRLNKNLKREIAKRACIEEALRISNERYEHAIKAGKVGIWDYNIESGDLYIAPNLKAMFGYSEEELPNQLDAWFQLVHPEDFPHGRAIALKALEDPTCQSCEFEHRKICKDGTLRWVLGRCKIIRNSRGKVVRITGSDTDINERKLIEEALRESEERFRLLAENATDMISKQSAEGYLTYISPACYSLLGFEPHEMQGKNLCDFVCAEDRDILLASRKKILARPVVDTVSYRAKHKEGRLVWLETTIKTVFGKNGKGVLETIAVTRDISERKETEQKLREGESKYRLLVENSGSPISFLDRQGKILFINTLGAKNLGEPAGSLIDKSVHDLFNPQFSDKMVARLNNIYESGEGGTFEDLVEIGGKARWFWSILRPFKDDNGNIFGIQAVSHDITSLKQAEEELTRHRDHLEELVEQRTRKLRDINRQLKKEIQERKRTEIELRKSQQQFRNLSARLETAREEERTRIAGEIHDTLGQDLTILQMDLTWLENQLAENRQDLLAKIRTMYDNIDRSVRQVQRISQLLRPSVLDNLGLIPAITWQIKDFQKRTGIECLLTTKKKDLQLSKDIAITIFRVFQEALTNIFRHAEATRVKIEVCEKRGKVVLQVKDNGRGITAEESQDLNSLGLTGIRERIVSLKGRVDISGKPKGGTTVNITVPIRGEGQSE